MKQLNHQAGEALESSRNSDRRTHFDEDSLRRVDVDLQFAGLVDRRVEEGEKALPSCVTRNSKHSSAANSAIVEVVRLLREYKPGV